LEFALERLLAGIIKRHPSLIGRLEEMGRGRIAIDPSDLPLVIVLEAGGGTMTLRLAREISMQDVHAVIRGPLLALVGLVDGTYDGDALFFSRDLSITGDIERVLALRNAVDNADVDLLRELMASAGDFTMPFACALSDIAVAMRRVIGPRTGQPRGNAL
jgi:predicted lipid carrier protein YhbT